MDTWTKIIRARPGARSRFHTERDELMPFSSFEAIPRLVIHRMRGIEPAEPWIARGAVRYLDGILDKTCHLLEIGSGRSTIWYAERVRSVVSIESDRDWYDRAQRMLDDGGVTNVDLRLTPTELFRSEVRAFPDEVFDVVIVDAGDAVQAGRVGMTDEAMSKVRRGGLLVLDNSDRRSYRAVDRVLDGWEVVRFVSMHVRPMHATETSVYRRPRS
jgi:precorrin-6B methylase 2